MTEDPERLARDIRASLRGLDDDAVELARGCFANALRAHEFIRANQSPAANLVRNEGIALAEKAYQAGALVYAAAELARRAGDLVAARQSDEVEARFLSALGLRRTPRRG